jgi:8-oxo-dGTP pyrophosphatase MutT (NUDIX family)
MGAGVIPIAHHNGQLYFLFGKENKYEKSAPGFADFGGGSESGESYLDTAVRELTEELTGFLGSEKDIRSHLYRKPHSNAPFYVEYHSPPHKPYRVYFLFIKMDEMLPFYYNNNQRFLQSHLTSKVIRSTTIFEKEEIRWFSFDELNKKHTQKLFRFFYVPILQKVLSEANTELNFF